MAFNQSSESANGNWKAVLGTLFESDKITKKQKKKKMRKEFKIGKWKKSKTLWAETKNLIRWFCLRIFFNVFSINAVKHEAL